MSDTIPVPASIASSAHVDKEKYAEMYAPGRSKLPLPKNDRSMNGPW